ncbi:MAG: AbrB/MazE/SpoVT family DNA-binding domain-containing protein [Bacteroidota bacterium]
MEVTIDKFGRVLIPKKVREQLGLYPGVRLSLRTDEPNCSLQLVAGELPTPRLEWEDGLPIIRTYMPAPPSFDVVEFIKRGREEYMDRKAGLS